MSSIEGGKDKFKCLVTVIRKRSTKFYECVKDLCIEGLFRSKGYKNTFLMPGDKLINHISDLIEDDKDEVAIDIIKSLILKGHFTKKTLASATLVGTVGNKVLKTPADVAGECVDTKLRVYDQQEREAVIILEYKGNKAPVCVEGERVFPVRIEEELKKKGGSESPEDKKKVDDVVKKLYVYGKPKETFVNFAHAVAKLVAKISDDKKVVHYLSANPILSFFFLTMNGNSEAPVKASELEHLDFESHTGDLHKLEQLASESEFDRALFNKINAKRSYLLQQKSDRHTLPEEIPKVYKELIEKSEELKKYFGKYPDAKLLMDELRFIYEDAVEDDASVTDLIQHLKSVNWDECKMHSIITDGKLYKSLIKSPEAFASGPALFVKSMYFVHIPINSKIEGALESNKNGGSAYASMNPMNISAAVFKGGSARRKMKKSAGKDDKLVKLVNGLSAEQKAELKHLL